MDRSDPSGSRLVIVALPSETDLVRKLSSEKEPHLTLLYLDGNRFDASRLSLMEEYVEHAASMIHPFHLEVKSRGILGDKNADVLFFDKRWSKEIEKFRSQLLQNDLVAEGYVSVDQYPEWTPHLTLGYPETPAKTVSNDQAIFGVHFDRIALWMGDYEGPTFQLEPEEYDMEVAMSQIERGRSAMDGVLKHYGVKGMKWGVRRSDGGSSSKPPASEDVLTVDQHKATIKAGTTRALSNKELKAVVERMQLEQQYSQLKAKNGLTITAGHEQVKKTLGYGETLSKAYNLYNSPAGTALRKLIIGV